MEKIYAPWREKYVTKTCYKSNDERLTHECAFCTQLQQNNDDQFFILKRFKHCFVMLNLYPYNAGHLMVLPLAHKGTLQACSPEERTEMMETINLATNILEEELKPQGFNMGLNIGRAGGGGIPSHLHFHVLPRWEGDTNFMPLICETKPISTNLKELFHRLKKRF